MANADTFRFLEALGKDHTFQTFGDNAEAKKNPKLAQVFQSGNGWETRATELSSQGAGVFVTVNQTDGHGRKRENILRARACFCDFDNVEPPRGIGALPPSIVVQSKRGKHVYWLVEDGEDIERWSKIQEAFARKLGADLACKDPPRVMRVPGFEHLKGEPFMVTLLECHPERRYSLASLANAYHLDLSGRPKPKPVRSLSAHDTDRRIVRCSAFMDKVSPAIEGSGGWSHTNGVCGIGGDFGLDTHEFWPILLRWNSTCQPPWKEEELERKLEAIHARRQDPFGYRLEERNENAPIRVIKIEGPMPPSIPLGSPVEPAPPPTDEDRPGNGSSKRPPWTTQQSGPQPDPEIPHAADGTFSSSPREEEIPRDDAPPPSDDDAPPSLHVIDGGGGDAPERPVVVINTDERHVANQAIKGLVLHDKIFDHAGNLTMIVQVAEDPDAASKPSVDRPVGTPVLKVADLAQVRSLLSESVRFVKPGAKNRLLAAHVPKWCAADVLSRGEWKGIRKLYAVTESPILRPDGTILQTSGYDAASRVAYIPNAKFLPVPEKPSHDLAIAECAHLLDLVCDFPFEADAHRSAWLASLLTPLARFAIQGTCPLFALDANVAGSGKSMLTDIVSYIVTGRAMARMPQASNDEEDRKRITSIAAQGDRLCLIDNIHRSLGGGALDAVLTATDWTDRMLGANTKPRFEMYTCWYATANNLQIRGDTARRCCHIRLECHDEKPEERSGFKYPWLLMKVRKEREWLLRSSLTILRAFFVAGCPQDPAMVRWGSFQEWSDIVRSAIVWCGYADPGETRRGLSESADTGAQALPLLLDAIERAARKHGTQLDTGHYGVTSSVLAKLLTEDDSGWEDLREALSSLGARFNPNSIGAVLRAKRNRWVGARCLRRGRRSKKSFWFVGGPELT